jgi:penicillin-binding protein 2
MPKGMRFLRLLVSFATWLLFAQQMWAAHVDTHTLNTKKAKSQKISESQSTRRHIRRLARTRVTRTSVHTRRHRYHERFFTSSFANDLVEADMTAGEDPIVRQAAIDALGNMNGTVVAIQPTSGRILAMVNQRLALSSGAQPCSTIKLSVALAALSEGLISKETEIALGRRSRMNLTMALAHSNNAYFEALGRSLGFEKVAYYAHEYGLGELAGYDIAGEQPGTYPQEVIPAKLGGVGKMCSFGEGISMTPLQLGAMVAAIANGGTLYYLQYPHSQAEADQLVPRIKRHLDIEKAIPQVEPGMRGAVEFGTAHRARDDGAIAGKTGTCSNDHTHLGWFGSFNEVGKRKLVVVVLLTGGRPAIGPVAAGIAGEVYRKLGEKNYFASATPMTPASLIASQICCSR